MKQLLILAVFIISVSTTIKAQVKVSHEEIDIDFVVNNPCTGEDVLITGTAKEMVTFYSENNIVRNTVHFAQVKVIGTGLSSGQKYNARLQDVIVINGHFDPGTLIYKVKFVVVLKSDEQQGSFVSTWNYKVHYDHNDRIVINEGVQDVYCK